MITNFSFPVQIIRQKVGKPITWPSCLILFYPNKQISPLPIDPHAQDHHE